MTSRKWTDHVLMCAIVVLSISLIVVGILNLKNAFPEELFAAPDGDSSSNVRTYKHLVSNFAFATLFIGIPRQDSYSSSINFFNVFPIELIMYGVIIIVFSILYIFESKHRKNYLLLLLFVVSSLTVYLICSTFLCSPLPVFSTEESAIIKFDFIYSIVVLSLLILFVLPTSLILFSKKYGKEIVFNIKQLVKLLLLGIYLVAVLVVINCHLGLSLYISNMEGDIVSTFYYIVREYNRGVGSQSLFICPSLFYCFVIMFVLYILIYLLLFIIDGFQRRNKANNTIQ